MIAWRRFFIFNLKALVSDMLFMEFNNFLIDFEFGYSLDVDF
jgi:hypothetical protein